MLTRSVSRALLFSSFLSSGIAILGSPTIAHTEIIDQIAARVDDSIITLYDVKEAAPAFLLSKQQSPEQLNDPSFFHSIEFPLLNDMINRRLFQKDADTLGVSISDEEMNQYLTAMRQQQGFADETQQAAALQQYGVSFSQFKTFARSELLRMRLLRIKLGRNLTVSDDEIDREYEKLTGHKPGKVPFIKVAHIHFVPTDSSPEALSAAQERAQEALDKLQAGTPFETVAADMSDDSATSDNGGIIGTVTRDSLLKDFADVAFQLPVGVNSPIVTTSAGLHIIRVLDKGEQDDPEVDKIRNYAYNLIAQRLQEDLYTDYMGKLRQRSFIDIKLHPK